MGLVRSAAKTGLTLKDILEVSKERLVVLIGPTAAGKDTYLNKLRSMGAITPVSTTSRPIRNGEIEGREYYFLTEEEFDNMEFIEKRHIHTVHGIWKYGMTTQEGMNNGVTILDYDGFCSMRDWRSSQGLDTVAVLVDIDKDTARDRYLGRGGDIEEFERRWKMDEHWLNVVRGSFVDFISAE